MSNKESKLIKFLNHYKTEDFVYPSVVKRVLHLDLNTTYEVLKEAADEGIIHPVFSTYCPHCQKSTNNIYHSGNEIPDKEVCGYCGELIEHPKEYTITLYQKV